MSEPLPWMRVCQQEQTIALDASSVCSPSSATFASPIDHFYLNIASLIPLGVDEDLKRNPALGRVLLLGVVSATENYLRAVLSGLIHICPLVRRHVASLPLSFGALDYYRREELGLALLEHVSLATAGEVRKQTQRLLRIDTKQDSSTEAALTEYEKLCQLRHAAVHAQGELSHQNMQELGVGGTFGRLALRIELSGFHIAAAVCQNVTRAYNRLLYRKTIESWMAEKLLQSIWSQDRAYFGPLYGLFYSKRDAQGTANPYAVYRKLLPSLRKRIIGSSKALHTRADA